jgi:protein involved in ribonucleotide reduction
MHAFSAFVLGIVVTIGGAFVHDTAVTTPTQRFVNWDVVGDNARAVIDSARAQFDRWTK